MPLRNALPKEYYAEAGPSGYNSRNKPLPPKPKRRTFAEQAGSDPELQGMSWLLDSDSSYPPSVASPASTNSRFTTNSRSTHSSAPYEPRSFLDPPSPTRWPTNNPPPRLDSRNWRGDGPTYPPAAKTKSSRAGRGKPLPAAPDKPLPAAPWDTDYPYTRPFQSGKSTNGRTLKHKQKFESRPIGLKPQRQPKVIPYGSQRASAPAAPKQKPAPLKHGFVKGEVIETRADKLRAAGGKRPKTMLKSEWEVERRRRAELERQRRNRSSGCCVVQ